MARKGKDVSARISGRSVTVQVRVRGERGNALEVVDLVEELQNEKGRRGMPTTVKSTGMEGLPVYGCIHPAGPSSYPGRSCRDPCTVSLAFVGKMMIRAHVMQQEWA